MKLGLDNGSLALVNVYLSSSENIDAYLLQLESITEAYRGNICIVGDFNAKSPEWGGELLDYRGYKVSEFIVKKDIWIANKKSESPTFNRINGKSFIDLTLFRGSTMITEWKVLKEESLSDHNFFEF